jgi:hypothetical protein
MTKARYTQAADYLTDSANDWTAERMALFLTTLAQTGMVSAACEAVEMSSASAYSLRHSLRGRAFALGWKAALLLARDVLEDQLLNGPGTESVTTRLAHATHRRALNRGLSLAVLNRLDQRAIDLRDGEMALVRSVAGNFEDFIELILSGGSDAALAQFLIAHPDPLAAQVAAMRPRGKEAIG